MKTLESAHSCVKGLAAKFIEICGEAYVSTDAKEMRSYESDQTLDYSFPFDILVKPGSATEISAILKLCNHFQFPVIPRGGGSGVTGGALPVKRGVVLSMERLNKIISINRLEQYVIAEAGVITSELCSAVAAEGLYFPVEPTSSSFSFIGGNVAENAGCIRSCKFGTTAQYVLNLEVVFPNGEIIWTGANVPKNATGLNITPLFIGSEGMLGVITKVVYKLLIAPPREVMVLAAFNDLQNACNAVAAIKESGLQPSVAELIDRSAITLTVSSLQEAMPLVTDDVAAHLLLAFQQEHEDRLNNSLLKAGSIIEQHGGSDMLVAEDDLQKQLLCKLRFSIGQAMVAENRQYRDMDVSIPLVMLYRYLSQVQLISRKYGITAICFGHALDGNMHTMLLKETNGGIGQHDNFEKAVHEIYEYAIINGGVISGEHGIGLIQRPYMPLQFSTTQLKWMKRIKQLFDPNGILNPGKVF